MSAAKQFALEALEKTFQEAGVPTKRTKDGALLAKCFDATFDYLTGNREPYFAPLLCRCPQREYPHELSVHRKARFEKPGLREVYEDQQERMVRFAPDGMRWPWSLGRIGEET